MTPSKEEPPAQLPEIILRVPTEQYGYAEVRVPIAWKDFMGTANVKAIAVAVLNISDAIREEVDSRKSARQAVHTEKAKEQREKVEAEKTVAKDAAIQKIIDEEPDAIIEKRKALGLPIEEMTDKSTATILYNERQGPPKKPASPPKTAAQKAASAPASSYDSAPLPDADYGNKVRFYEGEYGWSAYLDKDKEAAIPTVFEWLIAIPMEIRHRRSSKYPCISQSGKYIMCNNFEKTLLTAAVEARGMETEDIAKKEE